VPASNKKGFVFVFGCFRLDVAERVLAANGKPVPLTPKVFDLLVLLAQHPGELLEKEFMLKTLWPETFVEEANLSVHISTLRRALESAGGAHYIETVPKRGYRFAAEVQDISPPPVTIDPPPEPARLPFPSRWPSVIAILLIAALLYFWPIRWNHPPEKSFEVHSIAVLPFRLLVPASQDAVEDGFLGFGMTDAIIRKLSYVRRVTVRATSAVAKFQRAQADPLAAGRELKVDVVLDGTIQHVGNTIRVSVQLLRVSDGSPIWADRFDDYFTNIFQLQDSISEKIVTALSMKLTEAEHRRMAKPQTNNPAAYQFYLRGRDCESRRTPDNPDETCIALYESAIRQDPEFALAYTGLASSFMDRAGIQGSSDSAAQARAAAEKAVRLDEALPEAHLALGNVMFRRDWDWLGAQREFDRALQLDPNSAAAHWYMALLSMAMGHTERALSEMMQAQRLDPASENAHDDLGWAYYLNRRYAEAVKESQIAIDMDPHSYSAHQQLGKDYLQLHKYREAQAEFEATIKLQRLSRGLADLGQLYALTGRAAQARAILKELKQRDKDRRTYESEYMRAVLLASLSENDAAFQSLDAAVSRRLSRAIWMGVDPDLDPLRRDPRFDALLRRVHLLN
jgi:DNA-binding winged helix-turn-helix (wHTH) protein/TolB-like protein/tetratricopeptide (TPR) repeat protein